MVMSVVFIKMTVVGRDTLFIFPSAWFSPSIPLPPQLDGGYGSTQEGFSITDGKHWHTVPLASSGTVVGAAPTSRQGVGGLLQAN